MLAGYVDGFNKVFVVKTFDDINNFNYDDDDDEQKIVNEARKRNCNNHSTIHPVIYTNKSLQFTRYRWIEYYELFSIHIHANRKFTKEKRRQQQ